MCTLLQEFNTLSSLGIFLHEDPRFVQKVELTILVSNNEDSDLDFFDDSLISFNLIRLNVIVVTLSTCSFFPQWIFSTK